MKMRKAFKAEAGFKRSSTHVEASKTQKDNLGQTAGSVSQKMNRTLKEPMMKMHREASA